MGRCGGLWDRGGKKENMKPQEETEERQDFCYWIQQSTTLAVCTEGGLPWVATFLCFVCAQQEEACA